MKKFAVGFGTLALLLLVTVGGLFAWRGDSLLALLGLQGQNKMTEMLPADQTLIYGGLSMNLRNQQGFSTLQRLYLDNPDFATLFEDTKGDMEESNGLDFAEDVQPWIGTEVGVALLTGPETENDADPFGFSIPGFVVALASKDDTKAQEFIQAQIARTTDELGFTVEERSHNGVTYWAESESDYQWDPPQAMTLFNGMVLYASDEAALLSVIDQGQSEAGSLAQDAAFQRVRDALPSEALAMFVMNQALFGEAFNNPMLEMDLPDEEQQNLEAVAERSAMIEFIGGSLVLEDAGLRFDSAQLYDESVLNEATRAIYDGSTPSDDLLRYAPNDALIFVTAANIDAMLNNYFDPLVADTPPQMGYSLMFGFPLFMLGQLDLESWVGEEMALAVDYLPNDEQQLQGWLMVDSRDTAATENAIASSAESFNLTLTPQQFGSYSFQTVQDEWSEEPIGSFGLIDQRAVFAMPSDAASQLTQPFSSTIADNANYQRIKRYLNDDYGSLLFVNLDEVESTLESSGIFDNDEGEQMRAFIGPMVAFGATNGNSLDNGLVRGRAYLLFEE